MRPTPRRRSNGLTTEEGTLKAEAQASAAQLSGVNERVAKADAALAASEKSFAALTGALADLTARRHQLQAALHDHEQRAEKLEAELANIEAGLAATGSAEPDLPALASALATAQAALAEAESVARAAEVAHSSAREEIDAARAPLVAAERGMQRLETEAKTIGKLLAVENINLWPPVMDALVVAEGYEKALGAALGDDLDAPVGDSAPMRWAGAPLDPADPALPEGVAALARFVQAPPELARRLAQIGVVERAQGARLAGAGLLKPGQRLVSREGDLWRWDGFAVAAARADRRGAPARRTRPLAGDRGRAGHCARRGRGEASRCRGGGGGPCRRGSGGDASALALARGATGNGFRARKTCRRRARDQPQCGAHLGAQGGASAHQHEPRRNDSRSREAENALAALPPAADHRSQARRGQ